jgi:hypothetical protein
MRQVTRKGLITVAAASGVLAMSGGYAHADSAASGGAHNSPGVLSGNSVQAPVHVPVNVCGNSVNVIGVLNPAFGNKCANGSGGHSGGGHHGSGGASASGHTSDSPGVASGNNVQVPVSVPVNACGNSVSVVGVGNAAHGNDCVNGSDGSQAQPPTQQPPNPDNPGGEDEVAGPEAPNAPGTRTVTRPNGGIEELAETGAESFALPLSLSAGMLLAGTVIYRRARASA